MRTALPLVLGVMLAAPASGDSLPAYFKVPPKARLDEGSVVAEDWGEGKIMTGGLGSDLKRGKHVTAALALPGVDDSNLEALIAPFRAALTAAGWSVVKVFDTSPPFVTFHYQRGGIDAWATVAFFAGNDIRVELVETGPSKLTLPLKPPGPAPEKVGADEDFPYLVPFPGTYLGATDFAAGPFFVTPTGQEAPALVSETSVKKTYTRPANLSNLQFVTAYKEAFARTGWQVVAESRSFDQEYALLVARYARNGRDLWASLHQSGEITFTVADPGSEDWVAKLKKTCRLPLYGVNFAFNRAALRPEFETVLNKALGALQADATVTVEVQGHTDNVGGDADNLRLSQSRADAVKGWLVSHGVAASRLTAKGYGRNQPMADNDTPEGRAWNRRVELARPGCR